MSGAPRRSSGAGDAKRVELQAVRVGTRGALVALFLAGLTFRPQIVGAGPLFPSIQHDLDVSHAVVGLLGTIPVLCMGLFAPPAALVVRRLGTRGGIGLAIALIGVFGVLRAVVPGAALVVTITLGVGVGMGLGGAMAPVAVKERFERRSGFATGIYTSGVQVGSALSSSAAVPIAHELGGWRWSLGSSLPSPVAWRFLVGADARRAGARATGGAAADAAVAPPQRLAARRHLRPHGLHLLRADELALGLVCRARLDREPRGVADRRAQHRGDPRCVPPAVAVGSFRRPAAVVDPDGRVYVIGAFGFVQLPGGAWVWAVCAGVSSGAMFALVMTLPLDIEHDARRVGALVGMMLGLGYVLGAASPLVLGAVRDATGSFTSSLWLIVGFSAALLVAVAAAPTRRRGHAASAPPTT